MVRDTCRQALVVVLPVPFVASFAFGAVPVGLAAGIACIVATVAKPDGLIEEFPSRAGYVGVIRDACR